MNNPNPNPDDQSAEAKRSYFSMLVSVTASLGLYVLICFLMAPHRTVRPPQYSPAAHLMIQLIAGLSVFVAASWFYWRIVPHLNDAIAHRSLLMSPTKFKEETVITLVISHVCIFGGLLLFFDGAPPTIILPFVALTFVLYVLFILPRALKYWQLWEQNQQS